MEEAAMAIDARDGRDGSPPAAGRQDRWQQRLTDPAWLLLPQRLFLGGTFAYAGLDKLADSAFFDPDSPTSIHAQIAAVRDSSPLRPLLTVLDGHATLLGVLMALGEIAVGFAALFGVRVRLAAAGGALISLSLLLTVTWATRPYYYGSDIVFLVCWLPLVVFGDGGLLSLQAALARRAAAGVAQNARGRRALLAQGVAVAAVAALGGSAALGAYLTRRRPAGPASSAGPGATSGGGRGVPVPGDGPGIGDGRLAAVADVPVGTALPVTVPGTGAAALLVRPSAGTFVAFERTCTHAGCAVDVAPDLRTFRCPCHGAVYDAGTGAVLAGPATTPLPRVPVRVAGPDVLTES